MKSRPKWGGGGQHPGRVMQRHSVQKSDKNRLKKVGNCPEKFWSKRGGGSQRGAVSFFPYTEGGGGDWGRGPRAKKTGGNRDNHGREGGGSGHVHESMGGLQLGGCRPHWGLRSKGGGLGVFLGCRDQLGKGDG